MFIVDLHYIAPLEKIDAHMGEHMKFLRKYYKENIFLASGRKVPRSGGIILMLVKSREQAERIMKEDPFCNLNLATITITEFLTSQHHPALKGLVG